MKITKIKLSNYKRFDDLTIDLTEHKDKKIIVLVGENGSGKSCIFDAFYEKHRKNGWIDNDWEEDYKYNSKNYYKDNKNTTELKAIKEDWKITIWDQNNQIWNGENFHFRTSHRYNYSVKVNQIDFDSKIRQKLKFPQNMNGIDQCVEDNYKLFLKESMSMFFDEKLSREEINEKYIEKINKILAKILNIQISNIGKLTKGGELFFEKGNSKNFPFKNLSGGEKAIFDLIMDLILKEKKLENSIFCIDEPELHINAEIQKKFLIEIPKLIPKNCQLWIATHSPGFISALLKKDLKKDTAIIHFSEKKYNFDQETIIKPIEQTTEKFLKIFETVLDDLSSLLFLPENIIYCEGERKPSLKTNAEDGLDAKIYNEIFRKKNSLFVSSGGCDVKLNSAFSLFIISKIFPKKKFFWLKDRDTKNAKEIKKFLGQNEGHRILGRREIENYLFDLEILKKYKANIDKEKWNKIVKDISNDDVKEQIDDIRLICDVSEEITDKEFKLKLAKFITCETKVYQELERIIFKNDK